jgi:hypothetical protein
VNRNLSLNHACLSCVRYSESNCSSLLYSHATEPEDPQGDLKQAFQPKVLWRTFTPAALNARENYGDLLYSRHFRQAMSS